MKVTLVVAGGVGHKQIIADFSAVDEKLEKSQTADDYFCILAFFCGKGFAENGGITACALNPFCVFENLLTCHISISISSVKRALICSHSSITEI